MKILFHRITNGSEFLKKIIALMGGTAGGQIFIVLSTLAITRLYTPDDVGLLAVYTAILSSFSVIASLRYQLAITVPTDDKDAAYLTKLSILVLLIMVVCSSILLAIFSDEFSIIVGNAKLIKYLWMIPIGVLSVGLYQIFCYTTMRKDKYYLLAITKLTQSFFMAIIPIIFFPFGVIALLGAQIVGSSAGISRLFRLVSNDFKKPYLSPSDIIGIKRVAKEYKGFAFFSTIGGLSNTLSSQAPLILFSLLYSPAMSGLYLIAWKAIGLPMSLITVSISNVMFGNARQQILDGTFSREVRKIHKYLSIIAVPALMIVFMYSEYLFSIVFGNSWGKAGIFSQIIAPALYFQFISSPLSMIYTAMNKPSGTMNSNLVLLGLRVVAIYAGFYFGSEFDSVIFLSVASAVGYLIFECSTMLLAGVRIKDVLTDHIKSFLVAVTLWITTKLIEVTFDSKLLSLLFLIAASIAIYLWIWNEFRKQRVINE